MQAGRMDYFNGIAGMVPLALMVVLINNPFGFSNISHFSLVGWGFMLHALAYPFLTVQRRMETQVTSKPGMLHGRYNNYMHCILNVHREEGFRGLYRGMPPHLMAAALMACVPYVAHSNYNKTSNMVVET